jgi:hypothetical protein
MTHAWAVPPIVIPILMGLGLAAFAAWRAFH